MSVHQPANFNLRGSHWIGGHTPLNDPPDHTNVPLQLYMSPTSASGLSNPPDSISGIVVYWFSLIKTPEGIFTIIPNDIFQPDVSVAEYYRVYRTDHFYLGFPSQFFGSLCHRCNSLGVLNFD